MTTSTSKLVSINIAAGVQPYTDKTALATPHYVYANKIRFKSGLPEKIGGWHGIAFDYGNTISGKARRIFSALIGSQISTVIGSSQHLYSIIGSRLTNITPLTGTDIAIAHSIETDYATLGSNPIKTFSGTGTLEITDADASTYQAGDRYTLAGAATVNGITNTVINGSHVILNVGSGKLTISVNGTASSTGSGGGASVVKSSGLLTITATSHGQRNGNRVLIRNAADTAGISAATYINAEFIIRNVAANTFDVMTGGTATSHVTGGGGASAKYQIEIGSGNDDEGFGQGYGMGLYGMGLYGSALASVSGKKYPRIWFIDKYGANTVMTPGNSGKVYLWNGSNNTAPSVVANAPTDVNYAFVSNNILVTFGAGGIPNRIFASDQGNITNWTGSSTNQVFDYTENQVDRLVSHCPVLGGNLIFGDNKTFVFSYIGLPFVWSIRKIEDNVGVIAPLACCSVNGIAYWMGQKNFYRYSGGNVEIIPANTQDQSTILRFVFDNLTSAQKSKIYCWYNEQFNEIWWHYPDASSNEPNKVARLCLGDMSWSPDTFDRTAAESPSLILGYPRLIDSSGVFYAHERGTDANGLPLPFLLTSNLRSLDGQGKAHKNTIFLSAIMPDSVQIGNISFLVTSKQWPQSPSATASSLYTVSPTTEFIPMSANGRFFQYTWTGSSLGQNWNMGNWHEFIQESSPQ